MGINVIVPLVITVVALVIIYVNNRLAPSSDEVEEE